MDAVNSPSNSQDIDFARKLIEHCVWEDQRVWRLAIAPLSDAQFNRRVPFGSGSIQRECWRIIEAESTCLRRIGIASSAAGDDGRNALDRTTMLGALERYSPRLDATGARHGRQRVLRRLFIRP